MRKAAKRGVLTALATGSVLASAAGHAQACDLHDGPQGGSTAGAGHRLHLPADESHGPCAHTRAAKGSLNPARGRAACAEAPRQGADGHQGRAEASVGPALQANHCSSTTTLSGLLGATGVGSDCTNVLAAPEPAPHHRDREHQCGTHPAPEPPPLPPLPSSHGGHHPHPHPHTPLPPAEPHHPGTGASSTAGGLRPASGPLAETGTSPLSWTAGAAGTALLLGGGLLYRRSRAPRA